MIKNGLLIAIAFGLLSCDRYYRAEIKNESRSPIILIITFDSLALHHYWKGRSFIPYLESYPNDIEIKTLEFDTINLVKTYLIKPGIIFPLVTSMKLPNFELFDNLQLISKDTLILKNKNEIDKAFTWSTKNNRELRIK
jgi:hypothetical protein